MPQGADSALSYHGLEAGGGARSPSSSNDAAKMLANTASMMIVPITTMIDSSPAHGRFRNSRKAPNSPASPSVNQIGASALSASAVAEENQRLRALSATKAITATSRPT